MSVAGLILAAGESRRMGFPKALLEFEGDTFLDRLIASLGTHCRPVIVVVGHRAGEIRAGARRAAEACFVVNENYALGQLSSLQCGLCRVPSACDGVLFTPVDHPRVAPATVAALISERGAPLAIPRYNGRRGHPVFVSAFLIPEFLLLPPESQAREVVNRHSAAIRYVDVDDAGVVDDVDTPDAYQRLVREAGP